MIRKDSEFTPIQIDKLRALGKACQEIAKSYKAGAGPNPGADLCFVGSRPVCVFGKVLYKSGFRNKTGSDFINNDAALRTYLGTLDSQGPHIRKLDKICQNISDANDGDDIGTYKARKKAVITPLLQMAKYIEERWGKPESLKSDKKTYDWQSYAKDTVKGIMKP